VLGSKPWIELIDLSLGFEVVFSTGQDFLARGTKGRMYFHCPMDKGTTGQAQKNPGQDGILMACPVPPQDKPGRDFDNLSCPEK
jgi:hypothetical protein